MARRITWSIEARTSRKNIFDYWNNRNKSKTYSKKLNLSFKENLKVIIKLPEFGISTKNESIKIIIVIHFEIIY